MVYKYLQTHDNYRVPQCLELCKRHDLVDATAWLLEKNGDYRQAFAIIKASVIIQLDQLNKEFENVDSTLGEEECVWVCVCVCV